MRKFLLEMGAVGHLMDEHLAYLQELYYASGMNKEIFRFKAEIAISETRQMKGDMNYFYQCLRKALHVERAK